MSNRNNSRRGGRGGRNNNKKLSNNATTPKRKKSIDDYFFYVGSSRQASDYETTTEFILNYIKKTFDRGNDIAEALRTLAEPDTDEWKPTLKSSEADDEDIKKIENEQLKMEYKAELDEAMKRKRVYQDNTYKAYALLWERCAKAMQNRLLAKINYESNIYNKPIELLKAIKEHALNYQETRYEMAIISDAFRILFSSKQKEKESLQDYTRRYKQAKDILLSHLGGNLVLEKIVKRNKDYELSDLNKTTKQITEANDAFFAFVYLENADQAKYGSLLNNLISQKSLNNDQYPRTIIGANNVLSSHKFDNSGQQKKSTDNKRQNRENDNNDKDDSPVLTFAQLEQGRCYCCGKPGHKSPECRQKNKIPKEEWAINKAQSHANVSQNNNNNNNKNDSQEGSGSTTSNSTSNNSTSSTNTTDTHIGWAGVHYGLIQKEQEINDMKSIILLDSDSTDHVFCNESFVTDIRTTNQVMDMDTNGGSFKSNQVAEVPDIGRVWFNTNALTNILSMAKVADKYKITFDSTKERAFHVHMPNKIIKFKQLKSGLYGLIPQEYGNIITKNINGLFYNETVKDNLKFLTPRQQKRAKKARELYHAMGTPTAKDLKAMIRMNLIRNNTITTEDVNLATRVFGEIDELKGKATRSRPNQVIDNTIEIPDELLDIQRNVIISMDGMEVNGLKFLTSIAHELYYRVAQYVPRGTAMEYERCLTELAALYRQGEFILTEIHCDNEFRGGVAAWAARQNPPIRMNYATAQEHVPRAERNNRTLQERVRASYHHMPYRKLPRIMVKTMVMEAARKMNYFPAKHGVSKHYSPRMILHQENLDYEMHCMHALGDYVQALAEPVRTNTTAVRTLDCIYLRPSGNRQGGHELLHLQTNAVVTCRKIWKLPITPHVIKMVHDLADLDHMPPGLKLKSRTGEILFDAAWTAGVDYNQDEFDDINDDDFSQSESEDGDNYDELEDDDYDEVNENELAEIMNDTNEFNTPNDNNNNNENNNDEFNTPNDNNNNNNNDNNNDNDNNENNNDNNNNETNNDNNNNELNTNADQHDNNNNQNDNNHDDNDNDEADTNAEEEEEEDNDDIGIDNNEVEWTNPEPEHEIVFGDISDDDESEYSNSDEDDISLQADEDEETNPNLRRTTRVRYPPRSLKGFQHLQAKEKIEEYTEETAPVIALVMNYLMMNTKGLLPLQVLNFVQSYSLKAGLKKFGQKGKQAALKEMKQLHDRQVFKPIKVDELTKQERKRAMESLIALVEKRDGRIKGRTCANGSTQRSYIGKEESTSPTASTEAILITATIDAKQQRDVMTMDIPNAFVQTPIPTGKGIEKIIMKIRGSLVDLLLEMSPDSYKEYVTYENGKKVLYVQLLMALYGMLVSSILYYKKFRKDIESIGFEVNPYDICIANRIVNGKQHTITWHVDDVKSSHVDPKVNDDFYKWCENKYGDDEIGHVTVVRGKKHDYLAMILDYSEKGKVKVDMRYYIESMIKDFPFKLNKRAITPWTEKLMKIDNTAKKLDEERQAIMHTFTMKAMFLCKRARPDINLGIGFLATRVREPNEGDWSKLLRIMNYLKQTKEDILTLEADDDQVLKWFVDAAFAVHADMRSHTGGIFTMGKGAIVSDSLKQKVNSRSSTEAELNAIDDEIPKIVWSKLFIEMQGFKVRLMVIYQDNTSTLKMAINGKASCSKRTRHFDIKLFYIYDLVTRKTLSVEYCPTEDMIADYNTKPTLGAKFKYLRDIIMNLSNKTHEISQTVGQQECVGKQNYVTVSKSVKVASDD